MREKEYTYVFLEYVTRVTDLDSRNVLASYLQLNENIPADEIEGRCVEFALNRDQDIQMLLCGNTGEAEFIGPTGRKVEVHTYKKEEIIDSARPGLTTTRNTKITESTELLPRQEEFEFENIAEHG